MLVGICHVRTQKDSLVFLYSPLQWTPILVVSLPSENGRISLHVKYYLQTALFPDEELEPMEEP